MQKEKMPAKGSPGGLLVCPSCGVEVDQRDLHVRFGLPDPVLSLPEAEQAQYAGEDIISVPEIGAFARVLLPIQLTGGYRLTIGTWLGLVEEATYNEAVRLWDSPDYGTLQLKGKLANQIWPWRRLLGASARAAVREDHQVPFVTEVRSFRLRKLVSNTWDRTKVMSAFPADLWHRHTD